VTWSNKLADLRADYDDRWRRMNELVEAAQAEKRDLSLDEKARFDSLSDEAASLKERIKRKEDDDSMRRAADNLGRDPLDERRSRVESPTPRPKTLGAPSLGFTRADIGELQKAALKRQTLAKTVSSTQSPMSNEIDYRHPPLPFLRDAVRILDLIPVERTEQPRLHYFRLTTAASAATAVAEGAAKPESTPVWSETEAVVRKLAHYSRANDEVIADFGSFMDVIGREMLAGLIEAENTQLLNGDGVAPNLLGLLGTSGVLTRARGTDSNLDALLKGVTDLRNGSSFAEPNAVVMNPSNFETIRLSKDTQGSYLLGNPLSAAPASLGGARFLVTTRIAAGTALMGNFSEAARVFLRQEPTLEVAPASEDSFIQNQTLIRAEERLALAVVRPSALIKITGLN
jgi:HK97 family phage major capsid protein